MKIEGLYYFQLYLEFFLQFFLSMLCQLSPGRVSPEEYGKYQTIFVYASILAVILFSSVNMAYGRYFYNRKNALLYSLLFFTIISLIAAPAAIFFEKSTLVILLAFLLESHRSLFNTADTVAMTIYYWRK